jgi:hypothetical protein
MLLFLSASTAWAVNVQVSVSWLLCGQSTSEAKLAEGCGWLGSGASGAGKI